MKRKEYLASLVFLIALALTTAKDVSACSIVGYHGSKSSRSIIELGLTRLEYRGYDSAGLAYFDELNHLKVVKAEGKLDHLKSKLKEKDHSGSMGIGHTRWATHGPATELNAHPHLDQTGQIAVVHNGIIENHVQLKAKLKLQGHTFSSDTDTEVIPHLLQAHLDRGQSLELAVKDTVNSLEGSFAFLGISSNHPDLMIAARKSSPLAIGVGDHEMYVASDPLAFAGATNKVLYLPDNSFALITKDIISLYSFDGEKLPVHLSTLDVPPSAYEKLGHDHFMLKEIYEQRQAIRSAVSYYKSLGSDIWKQLGVSLDSLRNLETIHIFGCGTSGHAANIGQFFFENITGIPTSIHLASEFRYKRFFPGPNSLYIGISQSGETADVLEALRMIKSENLPVTTLTNVPTSSLARESDGFLQLKAGPEIAVASTKAFTTQLTALYWISNALAVERGLLPKSHMEETEKELLHAADMLEQAIDNYKVPIIQSLAKQYSKATRFMYLGRHIGYPFALEGALKLKEISYIFAQGFAAGELKHGSIALVEPETPIVLFSHQDSMIYQKLVANAQEVKARKGHIIAFAFENQAELIKLADTTFIIPRVAPLLEPLVMSGLMQFFAYQVAKELGHDIDKPRNLAKAVTVE